MHFPVLDRRKCDLENSRETSWHWFLFYINFGVTNFYLAAESDNQSQFFCAGIVPINYKLWAIFDLKIVDNFYVGNQTGRAI
jgi:hypothetical protein